MSPQAVAGMIRNIKMSKRASKQNALRGSSIAALDVCDMCEVITKTPSPVKQIAIQKSLVPVNRGIQREIVTG